MLKYFILSNQSQTLEAILEMTKEAKGLDNMVEQIGWCPFAIDGKGTSRWPKSIYCPFART
jgi:hypothetical protein